MIPCVLPPRDDAAPLRAVSFDAAGTLSGEDVIPGFSCPVADLFV